MKQLLFIHSKAPHGSINAQEGLDAMLMGSAFAECTGLFIGDGILQLLDRQDTTGSGQKNFSKTFAVLGDYGVDNIYCSQSQLSARGLGLADLVIKVKPVSDAEIRQVLARADSILNF